MNVENFDNKQQSNEETNNFTSIAISTIDNPFDPILDFNNWFKFDVEKGYYTCSKLARLTKLNNQMSETEELIEIERAIDRIIELDPLDIYIKIKH